MYHSSSSAVHWIAIVFVAFGIATGAVPTVLPAQDDTLEPVLTLTHPRDSVYGMSFSPDGRRIASGGGDAIVRVWDAADRVNVDAPRLRT